VDDDGGRGRAAAPAMEQAAHWKRGADEGDRGIGGPGEAMRRGAWIRRGEACRREERAGARAAAARSGAQERRRCGGRVAQEHERVEVAAAVSGAPRAQPQATHATEGAEPLPAPDARSSAHVEAVEPEVGRDERAAAHGHREALPRKLTRERHAPWAGGADGAAWDRHDIDAAPLSASERRARREAEGTDHATAQRPAPRRAGQRVRRRSSPRGEQRRTRDDQEGHEPAGERQRDEDEGVWAWEHAPKVRSPWPVSAWRV
jgi:hypothetical protein